MEVHINSMLPGAEHFVLDDEVPCLPIEGKSAPMGDGAGQPTIAIVVSRHRTAMVRRLPFETTRTRPSAPEERAQHDGLIHAVDDHRVVRGRAAKVGAPVRVGEVVEGAGIDQDVDPERSDGEAQGVGVAMGGERSKAEIPAVEENADTVGSLSRA